MIASGEKTEEYRNIQTWKNRFGDNIKYVTFHRGYSAVTMTYRIKSVSVGIGKTAWGALEDKELLIIKLGDRIMNKYRLRTDLTKVWGDKTLRAIEALTDFGDVKKGDIGGYVESADNLSQRRYALR